MVIKVYKSGSDEVVIRPGEELSYLSVKEFSSVLVKIKGLMPASTLTYNLEDTCWVDSIGLGMMYNTYVSLRREASNFRIINVSGQVLERIKTGRLDRQYIIVGDVSSQDHRPRRA